MTTSEYTSFVVLFCCVLFVFGTFLFADLCMHFLWIRGYTFVLIRAYTFCEVDEVMLFCEFVLVLFCGFVVVLSCGFVVALSCVLCFRFVLFSWLGFCC